jgi:hypothetical protein
VQAQYEIGQDPKEFAHMFCCRDLDWGKAMCGYEDSDPTIMSESENVCTMGIEAGGGIDGLMASSRCPVDDQPRPDDETMDRMIAERNLPPLTSPAVSWAEASAQIGAHD